MRIGYVLLLIEIASFQYAGVGEVVRTGMREKGIVLRSAPFTEVHLERIARAELGAKPRVNFIKLDVYGKNGGAPLPKPSHTTYDHWRELYLTYSQASYEVAEMISIGANAALRIHDGTGAVRTLVLEGTDPLHVQVQGDQFEILYFAFTSPSPYIQQRADVYVRTDAPLRATAGSELARQLQAVFPDLELSLFIRNNQWFIANPTYPFFNPFVEGEPPPTMREYQEGHTLACRVISGLPSCTIR